MLKSKIMQIIFEVTLLAESGMSVAVYFTIDGSTIKQDAERREKDDFELVQTWVDGFIGIGKELTKSRIHYTKLDNDEHYAVLSYKGMNGSIWFCKDVPSGYYDQKIPIPLVTKKVN